MSYQTLKILHIAGLALTFMGLAGVLGMKMNGGGRPKRHWVFFVVHGVGLLLLLASGFGLVDRLGLMRGTRALPGWVQAKLVIWLLAGAAVSLASRLSRYAELVLLFFTALVVAGAWLAITKPF
ncbi:MAG: SirB2 family protein [Verrucomicrobiota bacterium]|nr:SirB2 family protein [Verrucomicrobiota bacterium]